MSDGLKPKHRAAIVAALAANQRVERAVLFGSRATQTHSTTSDVDIALFGEHLTSTDLAELSAAVDEIPTAQSVDLVLHRSIDNPALLKHIREHGVELKGWQDVVLGKAVPDSFREQSERDYVALGGNDATKREWLFHPPFPTHWQSRSLYSMATWVNGIAFRNIQFSEAGRPVIKITEIKGGISGQTKFTRQTFDESVLVRPGDLLFSWSGKPETSIDAFWWRGPEGWLNQHIFKVTPVAELHTGFFYYLLRYLRPNFVDIARNKQTTGLGHVTKHDLENMEAAYPPLPEQRAIAHILGALDDKIELNRRMNETLEAMARALFKSWFVDFDPVRARMEGRDTGLPEEVADLFPDRLADSELGEIPAGWEVKTLGELCHKPQYGYTASAKADAVGPHFLRISDINKKSWVSWSDVPYCEITDDDLLKYRLGKGEILIARMADPGHGILIEEDAEAVFASYLIRFKPAKRHNARILQYWLKSDKYWQLVRGRSAGTTRGSLNAQVLSGFPLLVSSNAVAKAFSAAVDVFRDRLVLSVKEMELLASLRDTLLPKLISGDIRVHEAELLMGSII